MRARNLKPDFFTDEALVECDPLARLLFQGLWCLADAEGRLKDKPKQIRIKVLPCDDCDPDDLLEQLSSHDLIIRYEVDGERYIQVRNFLVHQKPHPREKSCNFPASPEKPGNYTASREITRPARLFPSSLNPPSSSLNGDPPPTPPKGGESKPPKKAKAKRRKRENHAPEGFEKFWVAYPRREAKQAAIRAWNKLKPDPDLQATIMDNIEARSRADPKWAKDEGQYIPHAATYLNGARWKDEWELPRGSPSSLGVTAKTARNIQNLSEWIEENENARQQTVR